MSNKKSEMGGERKRLDPFMQGLAKGAVKKGVDKVSQRVSLPVAEVINKKLQELHPNLAFTAPMIQSSMQAIIILGFAEMLDIAGPHIPGEMLTKASLGARFMREYAGEKAGSDIVDYAVQFLPVIMAAFSEVSEEDLMSSLSDDEEEEDETAEQQEEQSSINDLFLEEEKEEDGGLFERPDSSEELQEVPEVVPVTKRTPKRRKVSKTA